MLAILISILVFMLLHGLLEQRAKERAKKIALLEEALKNPNLQQGTVESLAYQLTGNRPSGGRGGRLAAWLLALGWLTLFSGLGVWVVGEAIGDTAVSASGLLTALVGFALVTYPFALRELESRRSAVRGMRNGDA